MAEIPSVTIIGHKDRELTPPEAMMQFLSQYVGLHEIVGQRNNPIIVDWFKEIGFSWVKDDETAWCSCTQNYVAKQLSIERSGKLDARSWMNAGLPVEDPVPGDIAVFWEGDPNPAINWHGHVTQFKGFTRDGSGIWCLGGNQSNQVKDSIYPVNGKIGSTRMGLLGFRRLRYLKDIA